MPFSEQPDDRGFGKVKFISSNIPIDLLIGLHRQACINAYSH